MRYIFIHIPKTSGLFVKKLIDLSNSKNIFYIKNYDSKEFLLKNHYSIRFIKKNFKLNDNIKFLAISRNPYDRIYSIWKFLSIKGKPLSLELPEVSKSFYEFLIDLNDGYYDSFYFFSSQKYFIQGEDINNIKIFKFEEINFELKNFFIENGINWSEEKINNIDGPDWNTQFNNDMKEIVYNRYREDFEILGYSK